LWDCPFSLDVWSECGGKIQKRVSEGASFLELVENMMKSLQKEDMELFVMVAVRIWKRRNGVVHGEPFIKPVMATHDPATTEALAALRSVEFCREVGAFDINLEGGLVGVGSGQLTSLAKRYGIERGRKLREKRKKWRAAGRIKEREMKRKKEEKENIVV
jgi:hypothetical protein